MNDTEIRQRIESDPYFIAIRRYNYDLRQLELRYPDGAPLKVVAQALQLSEEEVHTRQAEITARLRTIMGVSDQ